MRLLVVGGGGREHALVWKIKQSPLVEKIYCAPGNPGISELAEQVAIDAEDLEELLHFAEEQKIDLTVVGPEAPLVAGITDLFASRGLAVFGPNQKAAQMEGSKVFAKEFLRKYGIPTANFRVFESFDSAYYYLKNTDFPIVIKADGLAAGKGVTVAQNREQAFMALQQIMQEKKFGAAGERVVIEDCLYGEEVSVLVLTDGKDYLLLPDAQDHKAALEGDRGPNTGGMGAYSPAPVFSEELKKNVEEKIIKPVLKGLQNEGITYRGVLYAGLMITDAGPQVLEFNVRFGDPETQVILPRIVSDIVPLLIACAGGVLKGHTLEIAPDYCACVVLASQGYPGAYKKGFLIEGLENFSAHTNPLVFQAGTKEKNGQVFTAGGRVLGVTAWDINLKGTLEKVYEAVDKINFKGKHFRRDIGYRALKRF